ncbi:MAG: helix-turn-helix domain-containing protein [Phenylobacterium sp.]|uniref:Crp/Fnr family transcriptional regulator n=1 Tax=Phenylobacterium sp. TaxID=1871053 RepID=UPI0025F3A07F|nr:Crp/Fnr family transcriptional regulator [Phenylobacterium sp.]MBI1198829.1 helix-turn-helix domain-containing protein [Phenylobacterium sp.]
MPDAAPPFRNKLLAGLSNADLDLLKPALEPIDLQFRENIERSRERIPYAYFFETGLASVVARSKGGREVEVGLIGFEGMSGLGLVLGDDIALNDAFMQAPAKAVGIEAARLVACLEQSPTLRVRLLRYAHVFLSQIAQTAVSNGRATIEERLARWLVMAHDRLGDEFEFTHEFLSIMLGVRRPGVTVALHFLEGDGLIRSTRGVVSIIDREGLIEASNGGYGGPEADYARLLES